MKSGGAGPPPPNCNNMPANACHTASNALKISTQDRTHARTNHETPAASNACYRVTIQKKLHYVTGFHSNFVSVRYERADPFATLTLLQLRPLRRSATRESAPRRDGGLPLWWVPGFAIRCGARGQVHASA